MSTRSRAFPWFGPRSVVHVPGTPRLKQTPLIELGVPEYKGAHDIHVGIDWAAGPDRSVMLLSAPEYLGKFYVLDVDKIPIEQTTRASTLGWTSYHEDAPIYRSLDAYEKNVRITDRVSLKIGEKVLCPMFHGYVEAEVTSVAGESGYAETEHTVFMIRWGYSHGTGEHYWSSNSSANKTAIKKMRLE